ncbi:MAG: hypothetical protein A2Y07_06520 [Planctomycetes bacterium GWF2_50_10]|nr:MAG: hypothetical protein A2Y07_06520 [Planctomycetes bacterium GWF2_50_10]
MITMGNAAVDITCGSDVSLAGIVTCFRRAKFVEDMLFARVLVLSSDEKRVCIITLDVVMITRKMADELRSRIASTFGFEKDAIFIHTLQNHSAPAVGAFVLDEEFVLPQDYEWLRGGNDEYASYVLNQVICAVEDALKESEAVEIGFGRAIDGRFVFNRRAVNRDGSISMPAKQCKQPCGNTNLLYLEGPVDPELAIACFRTESLKKTAFVLNYTAHPVQVFDRPAVSGEWPGALCREMMREFGIGSFAMALNGCCGNINPWSPFDPEYKFATNPAAVGIELTKTAKNVLENMSFNNKAELDYRVGTLKIPFRAVSQDSLNAAQQLLKENPVPPWDDPDQQYISWPWMKAAGLVSVWLEQQREKIFDYEIRVLRIGDVFIIGLPGEPFVEGQLRIKLNSPVDKILIAHNTYFAGYIPHKHAFSYPLGKGGHEVELIYWSKLIPDALDMIVDHTLYILKSMAQK